MSRSGGSASAAVKAQSRQQGQKSPSRMADEDAHLRSQLPTVVFTCELNISSQNLQSFWRKMKQWLKDHHFNSVTQDFSTALPWLNYQRGLLKKSIQLHPTSKTGKFKMLHGQREQLPLQVYLRTDAIQSCHKMRTRERCLRAEEAAF